MPGVGDAAKIGLSSLCLAYEREALLIKTLDVGTFILYHMGYMNLE